MKKALEAKVPVRTVAKHDHTRHTYEYVDKKSNAQCNLRLIDTTYALLREME
jgi:hypothetical protein